jgi:iron(III) transport system ATP-binding protein
MAMPASIQRAPTSTTDSLPGTAEEIRVSPARAHIEVRNLTAAFNGKVVVKEISFSVASAEHLSLLGPSGCGKSTTLRCIAGLETPIGGEIIIDGVPVFSSQKRINVPTEKRKLSMVFQSYAIWPHMTVFENVAYGLRVQHVKESELQQRVAETLKMVGMEDYIQRPATDLSGGQQQRVALARSYASRPKAILLDEPLSNLDARLRVRMREEIKELQHKFGLSTIYVTHDQEEAMAISDRIIVMKDGHVEQTGKPLEIYDTPRTRFVADFIGAANILAGTKAGDSESGAPIVKVGDALLECAPGSQLFPPDASGQHLVAVRTVYPQMYRNGPARPNQWPASISRRVLLGDIVNYTVTWAGGELRLHTFPSELFEPGETVQLYIPAHRAIPVQAD